MEQVFSIVDILSYSVFLQDLKNLLLDRFRPKGVSIVVRVCAVNRSFMVLVSGIRLYEIHILIFLHGLLHKFLRHFLFCAFVLLVLDAEVAAFSIDGLLEDQRNVRMCSLDLFDKRKEPFLYHLCARI